MRTGDYYSRAEAQAERDEDLFGFVPKETIFDPKKHVECSECQGVGRWEGFKDKFTHSTGHYTVPVPVCCEQCEGTGAESCDICGEPAVGILGETPYCEKHLGA